MVALRRLAAPQRRTLGLYGVCAADKVSTLSNRASLPTGHLPRARGWRGQSLSAPGSRMNSEQVVRTPARHPLAAMQIEAQSGADPRELRRRVVA